MRVELVQEHPASAAAWDAFVARRPDSTSDHRWGWRRVLAGAFGFEPCYLAAFDGPQVAGILPLFRIPRGPGRWALSSIPFGNYGGICAETPEAARALLEAARERADAGGAEYVDLRHRVALPEAGLHLHPLYSRFTLPVWGDLSRHAQHLGGTNRHKLKRAIRQGARIVASRDVGGLYAIHLHTARRLGTPCFPRRYFSLILETFAPHAWIHAAHHDGRMVAYELALRFKDSLVVQLGGALPSAMRWCVNLLLFWASVEESCRLGLRELDYCRNRTDSGSAHHKRCLHLQETPLAYQYYLARRRALPQRHPSNPRYRVAIRAWQRLPLTVTRWLGPSLVRYLA